MDESNIIKNILNGDKEKYRIIVDKYSKKIFAYLYKFLWNNAQNAQELTQIVFIKAYENLRQLDPSKPILPWIYRIAHNEAINFLKNNSRKKEIYTKDENWHIMSEIIPDNTTTNHNTEYTQKIIHQALNKLDDKYIQVLILFFWEDKSYNEIADIIEKPINTVGTLISRAKQQLKIILSKYIEDNEILL